MVLLLEHRPRTAGVEAVVFRELRVELLLLRVADQVPRVGQATMRNRRIHPCFSTPVTLPILVTLPTLYTNFLSYML